jgi:hypothetical protein
MSERTAEEIRAELALERRRLDHDLEAFRAELRTFVPALIAGVFALALVTGGRGLRSGVKLIWKLL